MGLQTALGKHDENLDMAMVEAGMLDNARAIAESLTLPVGLRCFCKSQDIVDERCIVPLIEERISIHCCDFQSYKLVSAVSVGIDTRRS